MCIAIHDLHTTVRSVNPCRSICHTSQSCCFLVAGFQIRLKLSWKSWRTDMLKCRLGPWRYLDNFDWISKLLSRKFFTSQVAGNPVWSFKNLFSPYAKLQSVMWWQRLARKGWALRISNCERNYRCENQDLGFYNIQYPWLLVCACSRAIVQWPQLV